MNLEQVIMVPLLTEKSQAIQKMVSEDGKNTVTKYCFRVHPDANKRTIKAAIQKIYGKTPGGVAVLVYKGKHKKFRNSAVKKPYWKKAIVSFYDGTELQLDNGV